MLSASNTIYINVGEMCFITMNVHNEPFNGVRHAGQVAAPFACSFNIFYIYQDFLFLFHKALHPPSLFLSFCPSDALLFLWYPVPFSECVVFPCGLEMLMFSSCNPKFFAVRNIHYPVNISTLMQ